MDTEVENKHDRKLKAMIAQQRKTEDERLAKRIADEKRRLEREWDEHIERLEAARAELSRPGKFIDRDSYSAQRSSINTRIESAKRNRAYAVLHSEQRLTLQHKLTRAQEDHQHGEAARLAEEMRNLTAPATPN